MKRRCVKICGLTDQQNIETILELKPDFIGLNFSSGSSRCVIDELNPDFSVSINTKVKKVGVFVNQNINYVLKMTELYGLDFIQLHGEESVDYCVEIGKTRPVIKAFGIHPGFDFDSLSPYENACEYFLFDTRGTLKGGNGFTFDHNLLEKYKSEKKYFLAGGLGIEEVLNHPLMDERLYAFDVNSRFEISPGIKNVDQLKMILV